ncbi:serine O-acetyltransferase [Thalassotalea euphylliae]|uniref:Serine acetyltransferase n=1 Tax=Thalassotalea euphylliae TaxID=1655234 RepID=A0A3E0UIZ8_9GAMM|nr:serine O-acetyltransferase [Thalassotalea euphylliae]REL36978.1 serine acetyltransferase [Thalassotalea euphylliae]
MHAVVRWYYLARYLYLKRIPLIPQIIYKLSRIIFACDLKYTADVGKNVGFFHNGLGVVIHRDAQIGDNCLIYQNVTIGGNGKTGSENGVPTIGKGVFIGAGAVILGPVTIGDGAKIGANSVVLSDVESNTTVVGIPARRVVSA